MKIVKLLQSCAKYSLGTRTKFQLEILTVNVISGIVYFREIILESSQNNPQGQGQMTMMLHNYRFRQFHRTWNGINTSGSFREI